MKDERTPDDDGAPDDEAPLDDALNDLERILEKKQPLAEPEVEEPSEPDDAQYTIPLLNEVLVPGEPAPAAPAADEDTYGPLSDEEICRRIVGRLSSEIDIIVQTRIEKALKEASKDIRVEVRNHIDIVLGEILTDLAELGPPEDDPE